MLIQGVMKSETKKTIRIYWDHSKRYKGLVFLLLVSVIFGTFFEIYAPLLYKRFFDQLVDQSSSSILIDTLGLIALLSAGHWVVKRIRDFAMNYWQPKVMADLAVYCYTYLHRHSFGFFNNNFTGTLVRRAGRFVRAFEDVSDPLIMSIIPNTLRIVAIVYVLSLISGLLAAVLGVWCFFYVTFNFFFTKYKLKYDLARAQADSEATGQLADTITNNLNVKLFNGFSRELSTYTKLIRKQEKLRIFGWNLGGAVEAVQAFLAIILEIGLLYVGITYWQEGRISVGDFALLQAYIGQIIGRLWDFGRILRKLYESFADANEMTEILQAAHEVQDSPEAKQLKISSGKIEFNNVTFAYAQGLTVIRNLNLVINPGERIALVGPSGGGKTTITKLLLRFTDLKTGAIAIDGQNIAHVTQESLRKAISYVPQDPLLFHRSLFENIRYGKPGATREEVIRAAKLAHCHGFISKFSEGYDTYVGERGVKLSGGERQRVAIARAILKNAPILVLDEATSSLDSESEYLIQQALKNLMQNKTTIVIAHRLSTIMQMDRILVLEKGKITEQGSHAELVKAKQGTYQKLWEIQAGSFV